jgi:hypothetical protein
VTFDQFSNISHEPQRIDAHGGATQTAAFKEGLIKRQGELQLLALTLARI